nr:NHL repeat-containing protein [Salsipaludibacter albus]
MGADGTIFVLDAGKDRVVGFAPDGTQVVEFGGTGREDGQLDTLDFGALAIGPDGTVHVVDNGNSRIQSFTPEGEFVRSFGSEGDGDGQFRRAIGIATDADGAIYVTDDARPVVQVFDAEGAFERAFGEPGDGPGGLVHATGIDVDQRGHVFVADFEATRVQEFDPEGQVVGEYRLPGAAGTNGTPEGVVALPDGRVWVTDYRAGAVVQLPAAPTGPDVDDLPDPPLVAGDVGAGDGALQAPVDLAVAPDGTLVVTDQQAGTVQRFAPA